MCKNNLIPFSTFSKDCFFEEGGADDPVYLAAPDKDTSYLQSKEAIIRDATLKRLRKYREIMVAFSINFDLLKIDGEVFIPNDQKEAVKWIVDHYKSPTIEKYRSIYKKLKKLNTNVTTKSEINTPSHCFKATDSKLPEPSIIYDELGSTLEKLDLAEIRDVIGNISSILKGQLEGSDLQLELNNLYRNSMFIFKEMLDDFNSKTVPSIIEEAKNTVYFLQSGTTLNDLDRLALLQYYMSLISHTNDQFRKVMNIAAELRDEELIDITFVPDNTSEEQVASQLWLHLSDFRTILEKAIEIYNEG